MAVRTVELYDEQLRSIIEEKQKPCVSIILPLHNVSFNNKDDDPDLKYAMQLAEADLSAKYPEAVTDILNQLHKIQNELSYSITDKGLGIFVSADTSFYTTFPFPVTEKICVQRGFEILDLLFLHQHSFPYLVLVLNQESVQVYSGKRMELQELKSSHFPHDLEEEYEYQQPVRMVSYAGQSRAKTLERDKFSSQKARFDNFLNYLDKSLDHFLKDNRGLILCGTKRNTSAFLNRSNHLKRIISVINGTYDSTNLSLLKAEIWSGIEAYVVEHMIENIKDYRMNIAEGRAEDGIEATWIAVAEGRGATLLVERDLQIPGFTDKQLQSVFYRRRPNQQYIPVYNAANELARKVIEKNGSVVVMDNGMLRNHRKVALITRY